ncbi:MAG: leucine-rich repeat domain-containing protein [Clostridia bacterium]|nr:leucine-rich repeat domain-containing protein [Clostridia bacterium]
MRISKKLSIAIFVLAVATLAGCSGQSDGGNSTSSAGESSAESTVSEVAKDNNEVQKSDAESSEISSSELVPTENEESKSGKCGDNAYYTVSEDGVLTISGTGDIYDYGSEEGSRNPWQRFMVPSFHKVVIENGITRIGDYAFLYCDQYEIIIPDSVTSIGKYAFNECGSIENIELPESIVKIEEGAFANSSINKINVPKNVKEIPEKMCDSCFGLQEVIISEGVEKIGVSAFDCCEDLKELKLPDTLTTIDKYALGTCRGITELTIPEKVNTINAYAFFDWEDSQTIYVKGKAEAPEGWDDDWKTDEVKVVWNA